MTMVARAEWSSILTGLIILVLAGSALARRRRQRRFRRVHRAVGTV